jgi:hypothetical protein
VAAVIDSCAAAQSNCVAAQSNCVLAATGIGAGFQAGYILVVGVVLDASVVSGWVPAGKNADENRCDDSARGTAPPPKPAS